MIFLRTKKNRHGTSSLEYLALVLFVISALYVSRGMIKRGFAGQWKNLGDTFGYGRQFDPRAFVDGGSLRCIEDGSWYDADCYEPCIVTADPSACLPGCLEPLCADNP